MAPLADDVVSLVIKNPLLAESIGSEDLLVLGGDRSSNFSILMLSMHNWSSSDY